MLRLASVRQQIEILACLSTLRHTLWFLLCCLGLPLLGQTNEEVFREYQFNFDLPGARANGMGGAFIGLADDATSSFANPAGLAFLTETAVTLDYRSRHLNGQTGTIGGFFNTQFEVNPRDLDQFAFFSLNFNYHGWYFGLFQHRFLNEQQSRTFQARSLTDGVQRIDLRDITLNLEGDSLGLGMARRLGQFKLGLTVNYMDMKGETDYERLGFTISDQTQRQSYTSSMNSKDTSWGYTVGLLHEVGTKFSWGAVWRANPRFNLRENVLEEVDGQPLFIGTNTPVPFVVPDVLGVGICYKVRPNISLLLDWQRVYYSEIIQKGFTIVESVETDQKSYYAIDDIDEFHTGMEWLIPGNHTVWVVRGGFYRNPLHAVTYEGPNNATSDRFAQIGLSSEEHYTVGAGWVFRNTFEIDLSANFWENGREITASFIWRKK